jgi:hypothetical protein
VASPGLEARLESPRPTSELRRILCELGVLRRRNLKPGLPVRLRSEHRGAREREPDNSAKLADKLAQRFVAHDK